MGDGAMGTYLYQLGFPVGISYEELNLHETGSWSLTCTAVITRQVLVSSKRIRSRPIERSCRSTGWKARWRPSTGRVRTWLAKRRETTPTSWAQSVRFALASEERTNCGCRGIAVENKSAFCWNAVDVAACLETFYDLEELLIGLRIIRRISSCPSSASLPLRIRQHTGRVPVAGSLPSAA